MENCWGGPTAVTCGAPEPPVALRAPFTSGLGFIVGGFCEGLRKGPWVFRVWGRFWGGLVLLSSFTGFSLHV